MQPNSSSLGLVAEKANYWVARTNSGKHQLNVKISLWNLHKRNENAQNYATLPFPNITRAYQVC